jgi:EAL domain-containing protein (putative c-di-GMP-specific phosphodiesterase class I)
MGRGTHAIESPFAGVTGRRRDSLGSILARDATRAVFQPILELDTGAVVGFEALARGPAGSPLARPDAMFDAARAGDLVAELDWTCRATAFGAALDGGLGDDSTLFVNVEPDALDAPCPARHRGVYESARAELRVVIEVTERALVRRPAELLRAVVSARERGWGVALDDIGADRRCLALMPLLRPDVLKLDLRLVQERPARERTEIASAVAAQAERTGAVVLAEGIESIEHVSAARSLGATLGQGWHLGRPVPLPEARDAGDSGPPLTFGRARPNGGTPFEIVTSVRDARRASSEVVRAVGRGLEQRAEALGETAVVIASPRGSGLIDRGARRRRARLARRLGLAGTAGHVGHDETDVVVLGPHFSAALVARDARDGALDFAVTHDRELVEGCARALMERLESSLTRD